MDKTLRKELLNLLDGYSHMGFDEAVGDFPMDSINTPPTNAEYSPWALLEHIRLTQYDILEYITNPNYEEPSWPDDYWPKQNKIASEAEWKKTLTDFKKDLEELRKIVKDPNTDLFKTVGGNPDHTIFREIIMVTDHNSYHIGEFATWRQIMKNWPKGHK